MKISRLFWKDVKIMKENKNNLNLQQLNRVVGGIARPSHQFNCRFITSEALRNDQPTSLYFRPRDIRYHRYTILNSPEFENFSFGRDEELGIVRNFVEDYYNRLHRNDNSDLARAVIYLHNYFHRGR